MVAAAFALSAVVVLMYWRRWQGTGLPAAPSASTDVGHRPITATLRVAENEREPGRTSRGRAASI
jgi:hypothetical protein